MQKKRRGSERACQFKLAIIYGDCPKLSVSKLRADSLLYLILPNKKEFEN